MADKHNDLDDLIQVWKSGDTPNTGNFKKYINFFRLKTMALLAAEGVVSVIAVVIGLYQCFYGSLLGQHPNFCCGHFLPCSLGKKIRMASPDGVCER